MIPRSQSFVLQMFPFPGLFQLPPAIKCFYLSSIGCGGCLEFATLAIWESAWPNTLAIWKSPWPKFDSIQKLPYYPLTQFPA